MAFDVESINRANRVKAIKNAANSRTTALRITQGWMWVTDGKTTKQVHPDNIQKNIDNGFRLTTILTDF